MSALVVIICPSCGSDLIEQEPKTLYCLKCTDEFQIADAHAKNVDMEDLHKRLLGYERIIQTKTRRKML